MLDHVEKEPESAPTGEERPKNQPSNPQPNAKPDEKNDEGDKPSAEKKTDDKEDPPESLGTRIRKNWIAVAISAILLIAGAVGGFFWYQYSLQFVSTDDAFIDGRTVPISLQVTGTITNVPVTDNQVVKAGALLVSIDPRDYEAQLALAQAQMEQAQASIDVYRAQIKAQQAAITQSETQVTQAQATLDFSTQQNARYQELRRTGAGTVQRAEQADSELRANQAALSTAQAAETNAERQIQVLDAQIKSATAQLAQGAAQKATAAANLSRTSVYASQDGRIAKLTGVVGQLAMPGQSVMILVPNDIWVTANFKETQLIGLKVGQPVDIAVDRSGRVLKGHVDSIQSGSGTVFSLLPAQNATGNYVKVVQRIPLKITFDEVPPMQLGPGMSVVPTVRIK